MENQETLENLLTKYNQEMIKYNNTAEDIIDLVEQNLARKKYLNELGLKLIEKLQEKHF